MAKNVKNEDLQKMRGDIFTIEKNVNIVQNLNTLNGYLDLVRFGLFDAIKLIGNCYVQFDSLINEEWVNNFSNKHFLTAQEIQKLIIDFDVKIGSFMSRVMEDFQKLNKVDEEVKNEEHNNE